MKSWVPNSLTALNLLCGCIAVLCLLNGYATEAIALVFIAAIADFLDGFVARLLKVAGDFGKELDSLADMVTFGLVPGVIMYVTLLKSENLSSFNSVMETGNYIPLIGFMITIFSALRLAKFNIDTEQSTSFKGIPTPANTLFFLTFPFLWEQGVWEGLPDFVKNSWFLIGLIVLFSFLLISNIPLMALKFKSKKLKDNLFKLLLVPMVIACFIFFRTYFLAGAIGSYLLLSILEGLFNRPQKA